MYKSKGIVINPTYDNRNIDIITKKSNNVNIDIGIDSPGKGDKFFKFTQAVPSSVWEIVHNLDKNPSVTVVDSAENVVIGDVEYINSNKLIVRFVSGFSGKAYLN